VHDYAADYSFRSLQSIETKTPLNYLDTRAGQGFESVVGSLFEGLSGCLAGTLHDIAFIRFTTHNTLIILKALKSSGFTPALT
jgi:hypothetical protein